MGLQGSEDELRRWLDDGHAHVLLDGFDEMDDSGRKQVREFIDALTSKGNRVTLSSRPHAYATQRLSDFDEFRMAELRPDQIKRLSENVLNALAKEYRLTSGIEPARAKVKTAIDGAGGL